MGKVTDILHRIQAMDDLDLFERFNHITRAQAIREYTLMCNDKMLDVEVRLAGEEVIKRMSRIGSAYPRVGD